tara:strand:+ start:108 stop:218 length:111 start_codon:yes stop_codon:yes gene_type:complete
MIQQVTKGIKITVDTDYNGSFLKDNVLHYALLTELK